VTYLGSGSYSPSGDYDRNVALGVAVVCLFAALISVVMFVVLPLTAAFIGVVPVVILACVSSLGLSLGWVITIISTIRFFGRPALWLLLSAPLALCWWWVPYVPNACRVMPCAHVGFMYIGVSVPVAPAATHPATLVEPTPTTV